jgi:hypothetical protein
MSVTREATASRRATGCYEADCSSNSHYTQDLAGCLLTLERERVEIIDRQNQGASGYSQLIAY